MAKRLLSESENCQKHRENKPIREKRKTTRCIRSPLLYPAELWALLVKYLQVYLTLALSTSGLMAEQHWLWFTMNSKVRDCCARGRAFRGRGVHWRSWVFRQLGVDQK